MTELQTLLKLLADQVKNYHILKMVDSLHLFNNNNNDSMLEEKILQ